MQRPRGKYYKYRPGRALAEGAWTQGKHWGPRAQSSGSLSADVRGHLALTRLWQAPSLLPSRCLSSLASQALGRHQPLRGSACCPSLPPLLCSFPLSELVSNSSLGLSPWLGLRGVPVHVPSWLSTLPHYKCSDLPRKQASLEALIFHMSSAR